MTSHAPHPPSGHAVQTRSRAYPPDRPALLLAAISCGCSTADGLPPPPHDTEPYDVPTPPGESGESADSTGGAGEGDKPSPEYGDQCGSDVLGWQTVCSALSTKRAYSDPMEMTAVQLEDELGAGFASLCCEGQPSRAEADEGCLDLCMQQLCEEARQTHMWWALEAAPGCLVGMDDCGFDAAACLEGNPHIQTVDDPNDLFAPLEYFLDVDCSARNASDRAVGGYWLWLEYPYNSTDNDPPVCTPSSGLGRDPETMSSQLRASEAAGTQAAFTWTFGDARGIEATQDLQVDVGYTLVPCNEGRSQCIAISKLDMSMPNTIAHGLALDGHHLILEEVPSEGLEVVSGNGSFMIPHHALRFTLSGRVNGFPIVLTGHNEGIASGRASPSSLMLSGLRLDYLDHVFQASLRVDASTTVDAGRPSAAIRPLDVPTSCSSAVVFEASSATTHDEPLSVVWWYPPQGFSVGPTLAAVMAPGHHPVFVIARDASGRSTSTGIRYDRGCL